MFARPVWDYDKVYARDVLVFISAFRALGESKGRIQEAFSDYLESLINEKIDMYATEISKLAELDQIRWKAIHPDH